MATVSVSEQMSPPHVHWVAVCNSGVYLPLDTLCKPPPMSNPPTSTPHITRSQVLIFPGIRDGARFSELGGPCQMVVDLLPVPSPLLPFTHPESPDLHESHGSFCWRLGSLDPWMADDDMGSHIKFCKGGNVDQGAD